MRTRISVGRHRQEGEGELSRLSRQHKQRRLLRFLFIIMRLCIYSRASSSSFSGSMQEGPEAEEGFVVRKAAETRLLCTCGPAPPFGVQDPDTGLSASLETNRKQ